MDTGEAKSGRCLSVKQSEPMLRNQGAECFKHACGIGLCYLISQTSISLEGFGIVYWKKCALLNIISTRLHGWLEFRH